MSTLKKPQSYVLVGNTGVGKSYIVQDMTGVGNLVGEQGPSTTLEAHSYTTLGGGIVIDTPGLADTEGRTEKHLQKITAAVQKNRHCVPVLVVSYPDKFTKQFNYCLRALSLSLGLEINQYVLVINNIQISRHAKNATATKLKEILDQVQKMIGAAPVRCVEIQFNQEFKEEYLSEYSYEPLENVMEYDTMIKTIKDEKAKIALFSRRVERYNRSNPMHLTNELLETQHDHIVKGAGMWDLGTSAISDDWDSGDHWASIGKALLLPFSSVVARAYAVVQTAALPVTLVADAIGETIVKQDNHVSEEERQWLEDNKKRVSDLYDRIENIRGYYQSQQQCQRS